MKNISILTSALLLILGCNSKNTQSDIDLANEVIDQSIQAHGGMDHYRNLKEISYTKSVKLFDSTGNVEKARREIHHYVLQPMLKAEISYIEGIDSIRYIKTEKGASKYINQEEMEDAEDEAEALFNSSMYILFQPFKLAEPGGKISLVTMDSVVEENSYAIINVQYPGSNDKWWFYFDKENRLKMNQVLHNGRASLIENLSFDSSSSLLLHHHRKSYFLDSIGKKMYLRAEYLYENYNLVY